VGKAGYRIDVKTSSCKLGMPHNIYFSEKKLESWACSCKLWFL